MALKPWEDRPHPKRGDKRATTTYAAVGQALSQWEGLETKLAELFSQLVEGNGLEATRCLTTPPCAHSDRCWGVRHVSR